MKRVSLIVIFAFLATTSFSQKRDKWELLFNGKDLSGWKQTKDAAHFLVNKGEIIGRAGEGSFLITDKQYSDFLLELDIFVENDTEAGIQFRSLSNYANDRNSLEGYQFAINPSSPKWNGGVYSDFENRWLYTGQLNPDDNSALKPGQWNRYRIECIGKNIRAWVNEVPVAYVIVNKESSGYIALNVKGAGSAGKQVRWKNIRIKTTNLQSTETPDIYVVNLIPNSLSQAEQNQGWKLLFDGESSSGWVNVYNKNEFPKEGWKIEDGMIVAVPNRPEARVRGVDIVSTENFGAFELQFEFNYAEGANSGVKYGLGNGGPATGLEYQILDDERHPDANGGVVGNRKLASLYDLIPADKEKSLSNGPNTWNFGKVIVHPDNRVEHWLNGVKVIEYVRGSNIYQALVARSKYVEFKDFGVVSESPILLQYHQDEVKFRSIKIRKL